MAPLTGRCMCEAVLISTSAPFLGALYCHCKRCQRRSGTTRSITALCPAGAFAVTAGIVQSSSALGQDLNSG